MSERSGGRERSEQSGASKRCERTSEWTSDWPSILRFEFRVMYPVCDGAAVTALSPAAGAVGEEEDDDSRAMTRQRWKS